MSVLRRLRLSSFSGWLHGRSTAYGTCKNDWEKFSLSKAFCTRSEVPSIIEQTLNTIKEPKDETGKKIGFAPSKRHNLAMLFTCTKCDTRSAKTMSRDTYEKGVVIVRCEGCMNLHLIADRLGWFGEPGSIEDFLAAKGIEVRKGSEESYEFTADDVIGWSGKKSAD